MSGREKLRQSFIYKGSSILLFFTGLIYICSKIVFKPYLDADFKFIWLAGKMWGEHLDPYGASYAEYGRSLFEPMQLIPPDYWFYPPNWWGIAKFVARFDYLSAVIGWKLADVALLALGCLLLLQAARGLGKKIGAVEALGFFGVVCLTQAAAINIATGQTAALVFLGVAALAAGISNRRRSLVIFAVAVLLLKPQIGIAFLPSLLLHKFTRAPSLLALAATLAISLPAIVEWGTLKLASEYLYRLSLHDAQPDNFPEASTGSRNLFALLGVNASSAFNMAIAAALNCLFVKLHQGSRRENDSGIESLSTLFLMQITTVGFFVSLHNYDFVFTSAVLLFLTKIDTFGSFVVLLGYAMLFRSGNLCEIMFGPDKVILPYRTETAALLIMFFGGAINFVSVLNLRPAALASKIAGYVASSRLKKTTEASQV